MSAALNSLMRAQPEEHQLGPAGSGVFLFFLIGALAAAGFVVLSTVLIRALPMVDGWLVSALCYGGCIVPVYLLHRRFTFAASGVGHLHALPRYLAVQLVALALATLLSFLLHGTLALPSLAAAILVIVLTSGVNYLVLRHWAFGRERRVETVPV